MSGFFTIESLRDCSLPDCGGCGLYKKCNTPKMGVGGRGTNGILIVGDAPDHIADRTGMHFSGENGDYLRRTLDEVGVCLDDCWLTNSIICHPSEGINQRYVDACRPTLARTIKELQPHVIIAVGPSAFNATLTDVARKWGTDMDQWRGWTIPYGSLGAWVCPVVDPQTLVRSGDDPAMMTVFEQDIARSVGCLKKPRPVKKDLESEVQVVMDEATAAERLKLLAKKRGILAWDYETNCLKPEQNGAKIVSAAFCLNGEDTWAAAMTPDLLKLLSVVLKSKTLSKVASNMKFEDRWTQHFLGHPVVGWYWDTMLAAHFLDNRRAISSVKFQAVVLLGQDSWDSAVSPYIKGDGMGINRMDRAPRRAMLLYNGMDALIEYLMMEIQMVCGHG